MQSRSQPLGTVLPPGGWTARFAPVAPPRASDGLRQGLIALAAVLAVAYNALLAFGAARGGPASYGLAAAVEIGVLVAALGLSASTGLRREDVLPLAFLYVSVLIAFICSLMLDAAVVDPVRNVLVIAAFTMLGARATERTIRRTFAVCAALTLGVLLLETAALETYAELFRPADYLAKSRGYATKDFYEDVGLSLGTIVYEGRFTFGLWDGPRTSSIFLEQVSINCFAILLMIYLLTMWRRIGWWERALAAATVLAILVTNNARMASLLAPVFLVGWFVFPKLPPRGHVFLPAALLGGTWLLFQFAPAEKGDDLVGRLAVTYEFLSQLTAEDLLLGDRGLARAAYDTGYGYTVASATILGAFAYWAYLTVVVPPAGAARRRCAWAVAAYLYLWLLAGGTATYSIKTAALLWLLVGFLRTAGGAEGNGLSPSAAA